MSAQLERVEQIIDASGATGRIEALLPVGVRPRQLTARTLMVGMTLTMLEGRDALLAGVHRTLLALPERDRRRLGVIAQWNDGEHTLTYRQLEYTYRLITTKLAKDTPDGTPSQLLSEALDALLEASVRVLGEPDSSSYAVDWTDHQTWSRPPPKRAAGREPQTDTADDDQQSTGDSNTEPAVTPNAQQPEERERRRDREASWGHRTSNHPANNEMFFGYYLQALTAVKDEHGPDVPELARRIHLAHASTTRPPRSCPSSSGWPPTASNSQTCSPTAATATGSQSTGRYRSANSVSS